MFKAGSEHSSASGEHCSVAFDSFPLSSPGLVEVKGQNKVTWKSPVPGV